MRIKALSFLAIASVLFTASQCGGTGHELTPEKGLLSATPSEISVSYEAADVTIVITSDCEWGISAENKEMVSSLSPSGGVSGDTPVRVRISENKGGDVRSTNLVVRYGSSKLSVPVRQGYAVEAVSVSDAAFQKALVAAYDSDKDGIFSTKELASVTELRVPGAGIKAMPELGSLFRNITLLDCSGNDLVELDIQNNIKLKSLDCTGNSKLEKIYVWSGFSADANFRKPETAEYVEPEINTPAGYALVWHDEFNEGSVLNSDWVHEVQNSGWVNNELQNYRNGVADGKRVTEVKDGTLRINCFKGSDGKIYSGRVYAMRNSGWQYGYVEASIKLPSGKGTWPAFWMMPVHFTSWPSDGEIDIMEEVGYHPDYVSSSLHADGHDHSNNTQVTKEVYCRGAEGGFHTYAMEWTKDYFQFYVDGTKTLYYKNPGTGKVDWPYDAPFYVILNLAWGGSWGGAQGVDESKLPVSMEVDYVRVFKKID